MTGNLDRGEQARDAAGPVGDEARALRSELSEQALRLRLHDTVRELMSDHGVGLETIYAHVMAAAATSRGGA